MNKGQKLLKKAKKIIPGGNQLLSKRSEIFLPGIWPNYYDKAKGCKIWDLENKSYYDFAGMGVTACVLGYSNDHINSAIIDGLKKGYDFIQASRYIEGGVGLNIPRARDLAIRYIHAPILSKASGFKWTDTTQGFRGYSRKMLLDPKISPFREIFISYELLAYLSYRTPKLGYKCIEVPSTREYPKKITPTKISFFKGNLSILSILIKVIFGFYNP